MAYSAASCRRLLLLRDQVAWIASYPASWTLPIARVIDRAMGWLIESCDFGLFTFRELTRAVAWLLTWPLKWMESLLVTGFADGIVGPLPWISVVALAVLVGHYVHGWRMALLVGSCTSYLAVFGQWDSAMRTMATVLVLRFHRGAGGVRGRSSGISCTLAEADRDAADGRDAKHSALRLFRADRIFLRNRTRGGSYRNDYLCCTAHGALHRARDRTRSHRTTGGRLDVGLHSGAAPVEGGDSAGPPHADGGTQSSHHADLRHGRHRIAHRREGSRL